MLVLSRKLNERIHIGQDIVLTVVRVGKKRVRIGIEAPQHVKILRDELIDKQSPTDAYELFLEDDLPDCRHEANIDV